jgi:hypothetical protein
LLAASSAWAERALPLPKDPASIGVCAALPGVIDELAADTERDGQRLDDLMRLLAAGPEQPLDLVDLLGRDPLAAPRREADRYATPAWAEADQVPLEWRRCRTNAARLAETARERLQIGAALAERRREFFDLPAPVRRAYAESLRLIGAADATDATTAPSAATAISSLRSLWGKLPRLAPGAGGFPSKELQPAWRLVLDLERRPADAGLPAELLPLVTDTRRILAAWREQAAALAGAATDDPLGDAAREWFELRREVTGGLGEARRRFVALGDGGGDLVWVILREATLFGLILALLVLAWRIVHGARAWIGRRLLAEFRRSRFQGDGSRRLRLWRGVRRHEGWIPYVVGVILIPLIGKLLSLSALPELAALMPWAWAVLAARAARDFGDRRIAAADPRHLRMRRSVAALSLVLLGGWVLRDALVQLSGEGLLFSAFTLLWLGGLGLVVLIVLDAWRAELAASLDDPDADPVSQRLLALLRAPAGRSATPIVAVWWLLRAMFDGLRQFVATIGRTRTLGDLLFRWRARQIALTRESAGRPRLPDDELAWFAATPPAGADPDAWRLPQYNREQVETRVAAWLDEKTRLPLALIGPSGVGHSAVLAAVAETFAEREGLEIHRIDIKRRILHPERFVQQMAEDLGAGKTTDPLVLARELSERPQRTLVLLDNADRLFLRRLGGFEAYRALLKLAAEGGRQTLWVTAHHTWSWHFLTRAVDETAWAFEAIELAGWRPDDLARLIDARLAGVGRPIDWETLAVLDEDDAPDEKRMHDRFYRVLREQSKGIPGVALTLASDAFGLADDGSVAVHLAELPDAAAVVDLGPDVRFVLAALAIHGEMMPDEILAATRLPAGVVATLIGRLLDGGSLERRDNALRLSAVWSISITDSLRRRGYLHGG